MGLRSRMFLLFLKLTVISTIFAHGMQRFGIFEGSSINFIGLSLDVRDVSKGRCAARYVLSRFIPKSFEEMFLNPQTEMMCNIICYQNSKDVSHSFSNVPCYFSWASASLLLANGICLTNCCGFVE